MRRVQVLAVFIVVELCALLNAAPLDWVSIAITVNQSVIEVASDSGNCTGFIIDAHAKGDKDRILTAAHCGTKDLYADNAPARIVMRDPKRDLMVLEVDDLERPALRVAMKNPQQGEEVISYGYGYALGKPMFRHAYISISSADLPDLDGGPFVMIDAGFVAGQSGGPCINSAGEVVSIVQQASGLVGVGVGAETLRDKVGRYLEKPIKP